MSYSKKHKLEQLSKIIYSENLDFRTIMVSFWSDWDNYIWQLHLIVTFRTIH